MALAACGGAWLRCSRGSLPARFLVLPVRRLTVGRGAAATVLDSRPLVNIPPFGACGARGGGACVPSTAGAWDPGGGSAVTVDGVTMLTESAKLGCAWGGWIGFESAGQFSCRVG